MVDFVLQMDERSLQEADIHSGYVSEISQAFNRSCLFDLCSWINRCADWVNMKSKFYSKEMLFTQ